MRQVPRYLLIGNGRLARHMQHYFSLLQLPFNTWHRKQPLSELTQQLDNASHILLLISDKAIDEFCATYLKNSQAFIIHFSGSLVSDYAYGAHPLMTFSERLYDLEQYRAIPFVVDENAPAFSVMFPTLPNPHTCLKPSQKKLYHALCVLSGNFSCLLWQKLFHTFESELGLPSSFAHLYLMQQTKNLLDDYQKALTGPLVRNDTTTIANNLAALANDPFQAVYQSFVSCFQQMKETT